MLCDMSLVCCFDCCVTVLVMLLSFLCECPFCILYLLRDQRRTSACKTRQRVKQLVSILSKKIID